LKKEHWIIEGNISGHQPEGSGDVEKKRCFVEPKESLNKNSYNISNYSNYDQYYRKVNNKGMSPLRWFSVFG